MKQIYYRAAAIILGLCVIAAANAAAPRLFHTPGYQAPTNGDPDDLLMIPGVGFETSSQVVYQALDLASSHPRTVPSSSMADVGIAPIVQRNALALTVKLPLEMQKGRAYRLWVVTRDGEWSGPVRINDPRPQWATPSFVYATQDFAGFGRVLRVVGRNLNGALEVRLRGADRQVYTLNSREALNGGYATVISLPAKLAPGQYSIAVRRVGLDWVDIPDQKLEVKPDTPALKEFSVADFGDCHPDDQKDDSECFAHALAAAGQAGGGIVKVPRGHWHISTKTLGPDGYVVPQNVELRGAGNTASFIVRQGPLGPKPPDALFTLTGHNTVADLAFSDEWQFRGREESRPTLKLGLMSTTDESAGGVAHLVENVVITNNVFMHVGRALTDDMARPLARLFVTHNVFGGYSHGIDLPGFAGYVWEAFRIDDTVVRANRFIPGSYNDALKQGPQAQGVLASGMGAGFRVDFSDNIADGTSTENMQSPQDPTGFRAGFFWNLTGSVERTLISGNRISCPGDKINDGEAIAFDESGNRSAFASSGTPPIVAAGPDWVTVRAKLDSVQSGRLVPATYWNGHWLQIVGGQGFGQARKVISYSEDKAASTVTLHVSPAWDVVPGVSGSRVTVQHLFSQVSVVDNDIEQRNPPCKKANITGPYGGAMVIWASTADVAFEGNQQHDADGLLFAQNYSFHGPSCPNCGNRLMWTTSLEIRNNRVEGEYDWTSDCSEAGIRGTFGASATPESPPPVVGFNISVSHNIVSHSDGPRGGGIDIALTSWSGPPPGDWPFLENLLIFHNQLSDLAMPGPTSGKCGRGHRERDGIRIEGTNNVRDTVLYGNSCEKVARPLADSGSHTLKICPSGSQFNCECQR
jgi:hypothetical protein